MTFNSNEYMRNYRQTHPEYYQRENERNKDKLKYRYNNDEDYRENKKRVSRENYYKRKAVLS